MSRPLTFTLTLGETETRALEAALVDYMATQNKITRCDYYTEGFRYAAKVRHEMATIIREKLLAAVRATIPGGSKPATPEDSRDPD